MKLLPHSVSFETTNNCLLWIKFINKFLSATHQTQPFYENKVDKPTHKILKNSPSSKF